MSEQLDSAAYYHIAYEHHAIMNPLSDERLLLLAEQCGLNAHSRVLDIGGGNGWSSFLLCRKWGCHVTQVDVSEKWTERSRQLFEKHGLSDHTDIQCIDAVSFFLEDGAYDMVLCLGTAAVYGGFAAALRKLSRCIKADGYIIVGETSAEPPLPRRYNEYLETSGWKILSARALLRSIDDHGLEVLWALRSTHDEWDRYMNMQWQAISDHTRLHPQDEEVQEFADWARDEQETYLRYQRHLVDWNVFLLRPIH
jgi:cyclopropane fatty-acyl-phospholipid synthase-like methyltransferase